jgi:UDP-N-acetylmuramyl pentapeptide phosphotransferase/UDP-N-acetylglucosamine-1-phosphate transferase
MMNELLSTAAGLGCAVALMPLAIRASTVDPHSPSAPQRVHRKPTSRLGGGIIFLAYIAGVSVSAFAGRLELAPALWILACGTPVLLAGLFEDLSGLLTPAQRLSAAVVSALLAATMAGGVVARIDIPFIDQWLGIPAFAVLVTCFMVAGACNAINLIDGVHGLAGGIAFLMFLGIASIARHVGDHFVYAQAIILTAVLGGFLLWNFPRGRVFMGDGGAYFIGFMYAQLSIQLVARNESVSAWFVIMLAAYPIVETLYSIYRRRIQSHTPSMEPDARHLHSLVYACIALPLDHGRHASDPDYVNAMVAPRLWLHGAMCLIVALIFYDQGLVLGANLIAYALCYHAIYQRLVRKPAYTPEVFQRSRDRHAAIVRTK